MHKWVVRAAIVTGTLGFIGILMVFFLTLKQQTPVIEDDRSKQQAQVTTAGTAADKKVDPAEKTPSIITKPVAKEPEPTVEEQASTLKKPQPQEFEAEPKKVLEKKDKKKPTKAPLVHQKVLSQETLSDIYSAITNQTSIRTNTMNCVQLHLQEGTNNKTAFKQIERYLRRKKLTITGREIISHSRKGINVKTVGNCVTVVIGSL